MDPGVNSGGGTGAIKDLVLSEEIHAAMPRHGSRLI
jgi:hypothetical protein